MAWGGVETILLSTFRPAGPCPLDNSAPPLSCDSPKCPHRFPSCPLVNHWAIAMDLGRVNYN